MLKTTDKPGKHRQPAVGRDIVDMHLVSHLQDGLPISERPYLDISIRLGISETEVIERICKLQEQGLIKRFGVIVRHHELGFRANAMVVWDIPDFIVHDVAGKMKEYPFVTLCYRRPRVLPEWPYNLFCMIHGKERSVVMQSLDLMVAENNWQDYPRDVLFSKRRFKQRGASINIDNTGLGKMAIAETIVA